MTYDPAIDQAHAAWAAFWASAVVGSVGCIVNALVVFSAFAVQRRAQTAEQRVFADERRSLYIATLEAIKAAGDLRLNFESTFSGDLKPGEALELPFYPEDYGQMSDVFDETIKHFLRHEVHDPEIVGMAITQISLSPRFKNIQPRFVGERCDSKTVDANLFNTFKRGVFSDEHLFGVTRQLDEKIASRILMLQTAA